MRNLIYNAQTKETTYEDVPDNIELTIEPQPPTLEEQLATLQQAFLELALGGTL